MASCNDVFAEPMLDDKQFLEKYSKELRALQEEGHLPSDINKEVPYKVYSLEGSGCGSHRSIVLSTDDERFFSVELGFIKVDGIKRIYPVTRKIDASHKPKFTFHGTVKMSTATLLSRGIATMKKFGSYFKFCNNCQNFCNYYLEAIDLGKTKKMTDGEKGGIIALAMTFIALLVSLLLKK